MNRRGWLIYALRVFGLPLLVLGLLTDRPDAAHFTWLGHAACPGGPAQCENQVPAGFKALGDFDHGVYHTLDEASTEWRGEQRSEALRTRDGHVISRVSARFRAE